MSKRKTDVSKYTMKVVIYVVCIFLSILSILPFWIMLMNATPRHVRDTAECYIADTWREADGQFRHTCRQDLRPDQGFLNSFIISAGATLATVYFSALTAYALVAYDWRMRKPFFTFINGSFDDPAQVSGIGFYQFMYRLQWTNSFLPLILPAIAAPAVVFFMRQYLLATLSMDVVNSARIDGAGEFYTFNAIIMPIAKPAIATRRSSPSWEAGTTCSCL
jgi:multiple sugar transport system permease protein